MANGKRQTSKQIKVGRLATGNWQQIALWLYGKFSARPRLLAAAAEQLNKSAPNAFSGCPRRLENRREREREGAETGLLAKNPAEAKDAPGWDGWLAATLVVAPAICIYSEYSKTKRVKKAQLRGRGGGPRQ